MPGGTVMMVNGGGGPISASNKMVAASQYDLRVGPELKQRLMGGAYGSMPQLPQLDSMAGGARFGEGSDMFRSRKFPSSSTAVGGPTSVSQTRLYENRSTALRNGFSILSVESEDEMSKVCKRARKYR